MKTLTIATVAVLTSGCLVKRLQVPAEDHYVQTAAVAEACKTAGYGSDKCTAEDLDAMVEQAKCIYAITKGEKCEDVP